MNGAVATAIQSRNSLHSYALTCCSPSSPLAAAVAAAADALRAIPGGAPDAAAQNLESMVGPLA